VNGVRVVVSSKTVGDVTSDTEVGLGLEIDATGPLADAVLETITHSPLSVVLHSSDLAAPSGWQPVRFGRLSFAVPPDWRTQRESNWAGCTFNLAPGVLVLNSAQTLLPSCPAPFSNAAYLAGVAGMLVGAGPKVPDQHVHGERCKPHNDLQICIDPPPLHGGYPTDAGLQILTMQVYLHGDQHPDEVEIGLNGSGLAPAQIFDSLAAASHALGR
jgi:hypothetical protein